MRHINLNNFYIEMVFLIIKVIYKGILKIKYIKVLIINILINIILKFKQVNLFKILKLLQKDKHKFHNILNILILLFHFMLIKIELKLRNFMLLDNSLNSHKEPRQTILILIINNKDINLFNITIVNIIIKLNHQIVYQYHLPRPQTSTI